jgi:predicted Fe-S protein YdhL (DUF1289 family)
MTTVTSSLTTPLLALLGQSAVSVYPFPNGKRMITVSTPCCGASAKGVESGVACRACHRPVSFAFGWAGMDDSSDEVLVQELAATIEDAFVLGGQAARLLATQAIRTLRAQA